MSEETNLDWKDILMRALWTFLEAFLGALAIAPLFEGDWGILKVAAIAGLSAVLSFVKTIVVQKLKG